MKFEEDDSVAGRDLLRLLFFVEGYTDIRFVVGLSRICQLTIVVPAETYQRSGLKERVAQSGIDVRVDEISGGRLTFQARSLRYLWRNARSYDVIVAQEVLRGALNANVVGKLRGVPVINYMGIAPIEYFRCRRERRQIGWFKAAIGIFVIRTLMNCNGHLADRWLAMGPYLLAVAARYCPRSEIGLYYGVDTDFFRPVSATEKVALREKHRLPKDKFLIFLSSRISHEKDPETVLTAVSIARERGLDAVLLNLGGGYREFLQLARELHLPGAEEWVLGRPAVNPITEVAEFFQAADAMALASLAEGAAYSTLESLACGTPVVATAVGGMAVQLEGYARLTPRQDPLRMAEELLWVASNPVEAKAEALRGREYVQRDWNRSKAFDDLAHCLRTVSQAGKK